MEQVPIKDLSRNTKPIFGLDYLINPSFQGVNTLFVLPFLDNTVRVRHTKYFLPNVEIKNYNAMIDRKIFFD